MATTSRAHLLWYVPCTILNPCATPCPLPLQRFSLLVCTRAVRRNLLHWEGQVSITLRAYILTLFDCSLTPIALFRLQSSRQRGRAPAARELLEDAPGAASLLLRQPPAGVDPRRGAGPPPHCVWQRGRSFFVVAGSTICGTAIRRGEQGTSAFEWGCKSTTARNRPMGWLGGRRPDGVHTGTRRQ